MLNLFENKKGYRIRIYCNLLNFNVIQTGFEPVTRSLEGCCSIQLSYWTNLGAQNYTLFLFDQRIIQNFYRVVGCVRGAVFYLMPAAGSRCCNQRCCRTGADCGKKNQFPNLHA